LSFACVSVQAIATIACASKNAFICSKKFNQEKSADNRWRNRDG
jgi:hypothetical protein